MVTQYPQIASGETMGARDDDGDDIGFGARVTRFLKRIRVWRSRKHATVVT